MFARGCRCVLLTAVLLMAAGGRVSSRAGEVESTETKRDAFLNAPFEIALIANPSTGYKWRIDAMASSGLDGLAIEHAGMTPPPCRDGRPLVGARSIESWLVTPSARGMSRLVFVYSRPGSDDPPKSLHTFIIEARD